MKIINNKITIIIITIPLTIFFLIGSAGLLLKIFNYGYVPYVDPNPDRKFLLDGKLYFYDKSNTFIGNYSCGADSIYCGYAYETVDDNFGFRAYNDGEINEVTLINERYAFIVDTNKEEEYYRNSEIILYDVKNEKELERFEAVKNYTKGLSNGIIFVKEINGNWRILSLKEKTPILITDNSYDYVAVKKNSFVGEELNSNDIITFDGTSWQIISNTGSSKTSKTTNKIVDSYLNYIIYKNANNKYIMKTYSDYSLLNGYTYNSIEFIGSFASVISYDNQFYIIDYTMNRARSSKYNISDYPDIKARMNEDNQIEIISNGTVLERVDNQK